MTVVRGPCCKVLSAGRLYLCALALGSSCAHSVSGDPRCSDLSRIDDLLGLVAAVTAERRPLVVHFWALWCPACLEELPRQAELVHRLSRSGVDVLFINLDGPQAQEEVRVHLARLGLFQSARHAQLTSELDPAAFTPVLGDRWRGELPATFVRLPDGGRPISIFGASTRADVEHILSAVSK